MRTIRFVLHPAFIPSATDCEQHFISASKLARLYNVPPYLCTVFNHGRFIPGPNDRHLHPIFDGGYPDLSNTIPKCDRPKTIAQNAELVQQALDALSERILDECANTHQAKLITWLQGIDRFVGKVGKRIDQVFRRSLNR